MRANVGKSLALLTFGLVLSLVLAEVALRVVGVRFDASLYGDDPITGWRLRPNASGWWVSEGHAYVRINSVGMHDREYPLDKPADTVRIAVLGDSVTAAVQVDVRRNFTRVLEQRLAACEAYRGKRVEVMNFGVPGFGTAQELLTFRHRALPYHPDAVILAFFTYNDVQNNHRALNPVDASKSPYFVLRGDQLVLDDSFRETLRRQLYGRLRDAFGDLVNRSRVAQLVADVFVRRMVFRRATRQEAATLTTRFGEHPDDLIYGPPDVPEMREAWRVTEALILALFSEARSRGVKFWLVSLSQTPQHLPPKPREDVVKRRGIKDLFYPDRRLEEFARRHAIPALILAPRFAEYAARHDEPLSFGDGHYNEHGHRLVGDAIAERLCSGL